MKILGKAPKIVGKIFWPVVVPIIVSVAATFATNYLQKRRETKFAAEIIAQDIATQIITIDTLLADKEKEIYHKLRVSQKNVIWTISNLLLPDPSFWFFLNQERFSSLLYNNSDISMRSRTLIATYYRSATAAKEDFESCRNMLENMATHGIEIKGLTQLMQDANEPDLIRVIGKIRLAELLVKTLSLRRLLYRTATDGCSALTAIYQDILDNKQAADTWENNRSTYSEIAAREKVKMKKAKDLLSNIRGDTYAKLPNLVSEDTRELLIKIIIEYSKPLRPNP
ncbi:MAG: hypothetical protein KKC30_06735 [Proteobacteria bacterium]|nr:hypothetical protein [Pseudomonadota bacterium]MBU4381688.1 hypothetical protein [Pseudomonadota bacterium]MBU4605997.1 hypothetical protein [Pseudomonadota bacterium]MCG2765642.1 hypothetical protein [Desulfarculaceae bacterium]